MPNFHAARLVAALTLLVGAAAPSADARPPARPADPASRSPVTIVRPGEGETLSIVEHDERGVVKRLRATPEEAAISRLDLPPETRQEVNAALAARAAAIDEVVPRNIDLLLLLRAQLAEDDSDAVAGTMLELLEREPELRDQRRRGEDLLGILPPAERAKANRMIRLHRTAVFSDMRGLATQSGRPVEDLIRAYYLHPFALEMQRGLERSVNIDVARLEDLFAAVGATTDQERQIRRSVAAFAEETQLNPTGAQRRDLFRQVSSALSPEQVEKLIAFVFARPEEAEPSESDAAPQDTPG